jgi:hypothetical protein
MGVFNGVNFNETTYNGVISTGINPSDNIVFNEIGLQNAKITARYHKHESGGEIMIRKNKAPNTHGYVVQDVLLGAKRIKIKGKAKESTNALFLSQMSQMKRYMRGVEKELKITEGGEVRIYTATLANYSEIFAARDHYHIDYVPWEAEFECNFPFARNDVQNVYAQEGVNASEKTVFLAHEGDARTVPIEAFLYFSAASNVTKIEIENLTTNRKIIIEQTISANDIIELNGIDEIVRINGVDVDWSGDFPELQDDGASLKTTITSTSHSYDYTYKFYNYYE